MATNAQGLSTQDLEDLRAVHAVLKQKGDPRAAKVEALLGVSGPTRFASAAEPERPSLIDRTMAAGAGVPGFAGSFEWPLKIGGGILKRAGEHLGSFKPPPSTTGERVMQALGGPLLTAKRLLIDPAVATAGEARSAAGRGETAKAGFKSVAAGVPLVGPSAASLYDFAETHSLPEAIGAGGVDAALALTGIRKAPAAGKFAADVPRAFAFRKAAKAETASQAAKLEITDILAPPKADLGFDADFVSSIPKIAKTAGGKKNIRTTADFARAAKIAAEDQFRLFSEFFDPIKKRVVSLDPVGDTMAGAKTDNLIRSEPAAAARISEEAARYRGPETLENIHKALVETNNELTALEKKPPGAQRVSEAQAEWRVVNLKAEALRDLLYANLPEGAQNANRLQGAIGKIRDLAEVAAETARRTPTTGISPSQIVSGAGAAVALGAGKPLATARAGASLIRGAKHPDVRFAKAWDKLQVSVPEATPAPVHPQPRGLLTEGRGEGLPPVPDPSSVRGVPGEYVIPETLRRRLERARLEGPKEPRVLTTPAPASTPKQLPPGPPVPVPKPMGRPPYGRPMPPIADPSGPVASGRPSGFAPELRAIETRHATLQLWKEFGRWPTAAEIKARVALLRQSNP